MITDESGTLFLFVGLNFVAMGYVWLAIRAFRSRLGWGIATLLLPPLGGLAYGLVYRKRALPPLLFMLLGLVTAAAPIVIVQWVSPVLDLGERNKLVNGERHLTLTGWDKTDYAILANYPDTVVLQMANRDVSDDTLNHVLPLLQLRELDLNDTQISDAGLEKLAALPNLESLRIARTAVTPEGLVRTALSWPKLRQLDVTGLNVPARILREWKNEDPAHRSYVQ